MRPRLRLTVHPWGPGQRPGDGLDLASCHHPVSAPEPRWQARSVWSHPVRFAEPRNGSSRAVSGSGLRAGPASGPVCVTGTGSCPFARLAGPLRRHPSVLCSLCLVPTSSANALSLPVQMSPFRPSAAQRAPGHGRRRIQPARAHTRTALPDPALLQTASPGLAHWRCLLHLRPCPRCRCREYDVSQGTSSSLLTFPAPPGPWEFVRFPLRAGSSSRRPSPRFVIFRLSARGPAARHSGRPGLPSPDPSLVPRLHRFPCPHGQGDRVPGVLSPAGPPAPRSPRAAPAERAGRRSVSAPWGWRR